MTKLDQLRALREARTAKVARPRASKAQAKAKPPKAAKPRVAPNGGVFHGAGPEGDSLVPPSVSLPASGPNCPTCGRFWSKGSGQFDKKAYMRSYMADRRKKTKPETTA